jgi:hypothetical protein
MRKPSALYCILLLISRVKTIEILLILCGFIKSRNQFLVKGAAEMSVMPYATVVGVFRDRSAADLAMQALLNAGFKREQIRYLTADTAGGFFDSLKSVFTGVSPAEESLVSNLTDMGLSSEEAQYFSDEYKQGSVILAIKTQGDDEMALNILSQYGAYNAKDRARFGGVMADQVRSSATVRSDDEVVPVYPNALPPEEVPAQSAEVPATNPDAPLPEDVASPSNAPFPQEKVASSPYVPFPEEVPSDHATPFPQEEITSNPDVPFPQGMPSDPVEPFPHATTDQPYQDTSEMEGMEGMDDLEETVTPVYQDEQVSLVSPDMVEVDEVDSDETPVAQNETDTYPEGAEIDEVFVSATPVPPTETDTDAEQPSDNDTTDDELATPTTDDDPSDETAAPAADEDLTLQEAYEAATPLATDTPVAQNDETSTPSTSSVSQESGSATQAAPASSNERYGYSSQLQQLLAQIEETQQQLQEARAQLEEAREHENRLTTARQQLQELQAELQATRSELEQTRQRARG